LATGLVAAASPNLRLNFDFTQEGEIMENVPTRQISSRKLFEELNNTGHKSDYIEVIIDPDSMLLPSLEIQKQTFMALFPVITNQITLIFSLRNQDPEGAAAQLMALEQLLDIQNQDIYDYIPKAEYDAIIGKQPSEMQKRMQEEEMQRKAKEAALLDMAGGKGGSDSLPIGQRMTKDGASPTQPQNPNEVPKARAPMGSAIDASMGRAANSTGFFPG
jgi:hypothetical protein